MLDTLSQLFKSELQYPHTAHIIQQVMNIFNAIQEQHMKDGNARNTAIDVICNMLQSEKIAPVVAQPATPEVENAPQ